VIHSKNTLFMLSQILRQTAVDYIDGKEKVTVWRDEYIEKKKELDKIEFGKKNSSNIRAQLYKLENKINDFLCAEEFWFDYDAYGDTPADAFWEKWHLEWAGWDLEGFRRMVKEGRVVFIAPNGEGTDAYNERKKQCNEQRVLDGDDWERGLLGGSNKRRASGVGSRDCSDFVREATLHAGCVC